MLRGIEEELRAHKYAHVERERRFLVDPVRCPDLTTAPAILIEDRYIADTRLRLRRMTEHASGRVILKIGKKYDVADVRARPVTTTYLSDAEYALFAALPGFALVKRRYAVEDFGIDMFEGALEGLMLAEIECEDDDALARVMPPSWAACEVTDDPRYQGGVLAMRPTGSIADLIDRPI